MSVLPPVNVKNMTPEQAYARGMRRASNILAIAVGKCGPKSKKALEGAMDQLEAELYQAEADGK